MWTKPKVRSGKVRKFVFLDWLLHLTPVHSPLSSNSSSSLEISVIGENEKPIRKDERRKDLEVICHSGLKNFRNMIVPLPKSKTRHPARAQAPIFFDTKLYKPLPLFAFFCAYEVAQSPHENSMSGDNTRSVLARFGDNN